MKRSELKVGDELYHATPSDWKADRTGKKVTVLAVEPYVRSDWGTRGPYETSAGTGVLVEQSGGYRNVVQLGHLRGPWLEVLAEVEPRQDANDRRRKEERTRRVDMAAGRDATIGRAKAAGYGYAISYGPGSEARVVTTVETLGVMLDRIDALIAEVADLEGQISNLRDDMRPTGDGS